MPSLLHRWAWWKESHNAFCKSLKQWCLPKKLCLFAGPDSLLLRTLQATRLNEATLMNHQHTITTQQAFQHHLVSSGVSSIDSCIATPNEAHPYITASEPHSRKPNNGCLDAMANQMQITKPNKGCLNGIASTMHHQPVNCKSSRCKLVDLFHPTRESHLQHTWYTKPGGNSGEWCRVIALSDKWVA